MKGKGSRMIKRRKDALIAGMRTKIKCILFIAAAAVCFTGCAGSKVQNDTDNSHNFYNFHNSQADNNESKVSLSNTEKPINSLKEDSKENGILLLNYKDSQAVVNENDPKSYWKLFAHRTIDGTIYSNEMFKGHRITVINGWAPWCGPCVGELPDLNALAKFYDPSAVWFISIVPDYDNKAADSSEYLAEIKSVMAGMDFVMPVMLPDERFKKIVFPGLVGFPTTWIVDSEGNIKDVLVGSRGMKDWKKIIDNHLINYG